MDRYEWVEVFGKEGIEKESTGEILYLGAAAIELNTLTRELAATEKVMNLLTEENRFYVEKIETLEAELADKSAENNMLIEGLFNAEAKLAERDAEIKSQTDYIASCKRDAAHWWREASGLSTKNVNLQTQLAARDAEIAAAHKRIAELEDGNNRLNDEVAELTYKLKQVADVDDCPDPW